MERFVYPFLANACLAPCLEVVVEIGEDVPNPADKSTHWMRVEKPII
jgi:hypothetical protein